MKTQDDGSSPAARAAARWPLLAWAFAPRPVEVEVAAVDAAAASRPRSTRTARRGCATATWSRRRWPARLPRITLREGDAVAAGAVRGHADAGAVADARRAHAARAAGARATAPRRRRAARGRAHRARAGRRWSRRATSCSAPSSWRSRASSRRPSSRPIAWRRRRRRRSSTPPIEERARRRATSCEQARAALIAVRARSAGGAARFALRAPVAGRVLRVRSRARPRWPLGTPLLEIGDTAQHGGRGRAADHRRAAGRSPAAPVRIERWGGPTAAAGPGAPGRAGAPSPRSRRSASRSSACNVLIDITSPADAVARRSATATASACASSRCAHRRRAARAGERGVPACAGTGEAAGGMAVFVARRRPRAHCVPVTVGARNGSEAWVRAGPGAGRHGDRLPARRPSRRRARQGAHGAGPAPTATRAAPRSLEGDAMRAMDLHAPGEALRLEQRAIRTRRGRGAPAGRGLRRLPHRPACGRRRAAAAATADRARARDRRHRRARRRRASIRRAARPTRRRAVARSHLRPVRLLPDRAREPVRRSRCSPATRATAASPRTSSPRRPSAFALDPAPTRSHLAPLLCAGLIGWRSLRDGRRGRATARSLRLRRRGASHRAGRRGTGPRRLRVHAPGRRRKGRRSHASSARSGPAARTSDRPSALDAAIIFAPVGGLVPLALQAVRKGGRVVCGGIHMSDIPSFPYRCCGKSGSCVSVANLTRADAAEFLRVAAAVPLRVETTTYPLATCERGARRPARRTAAGRRGALALRPRGQLRPRPACWRTGSRVPPHRSRSGPCSRSRSWRRRSPGSPGSRRNRCCRGKGCKGTRCRQPRRRPASPTRRISVAPAVACSGSRRQCW